MKTASLLTSDLDFGRSAKGKRIYVYVLTAMTILMSKTVYFGILNLSIFRWVYYVLIVLGFFILCRSMSFLVDGVLKAGVLVALLILNIGFHYSDMVSSQFNEVVGFALDVIMTGFLGAFLFAEDYICAYIDCIFVMSCISIPCVTIANIDSTLTYWLVSNCFDWSDHFGYSIFYTWGLNGSINYRNSGMFWEPGAFAGFLLLAIVFLLYSAPKPTKVQRLQMVILLITLMTTKSTTGYVLIVFLLLFKYARFKAFFTRGNASKLFNSLATIVVMAVILFIVVASGNIEAKLSGQSLLGDGITNDSTALRQNDLFGSLQLCVEAGLFGFGDTAVRTMHELAVGIVDNSAGLLQMTYTYGWAFLIVYVAIFVANIKKIFDVTNHLDCFCLAVVFLVLYLTEGLYWLPSYLILMFLSYGVESETVEQGSRIANREQLK